MEAFCWNTVASGDQIAVSTRRLTHNGLGNKCNTIKVWRISFMTKNMLPVNTQVGNVCKFQSRPPILLTTVNSLYLNKPIETENLAKQPPYGKNFGITVGNCSHVTNRVSLQVCDCKCVITIA